MGTFKSIKNGKRIPKLCLRASGNVVTLRGVSFFQSGIFEFLKNNLTC